MSMISSVLYILLYPTSDWVTTEWHFEPWILGWRQHHQRRILAAKRFNIPPSARRKYFSPLVLQQRHYPAPSMLRESNFWDLVKCSPILQLSPSAIAMGTSTSQNSYPEPPSFSFSSCGHIVDIRAMWQRRIKRRWLKEFIESRPRASVIPKREGATSRLVTSPLTNHDWIASKGKASLVPWRHASGQKRLVGKSRFFFY